MISYGRQTIDAADVRAVVRVLRSPRLTQGPAIDAFEKRFASYCGARYAVAVSSGTAALHLASLALELKKADEVVTSPISFVATANSVLYAGAKPVFADVDADTANLSPQEAKRKMTRRTKAIYPVHFAGLACDMEALGRIARSRGLSVVEDASHALGARYAAGNRSLRVGSCAHSDMAVFSFHPVKHITTGEGGMITTNSRRYDDILRMLRTHGIVRSTALSRTRGPWFYEMRALGFNYRMTDIQAALGASQLEKIDLFVNRRRAIAAEYNKHFGNVDALSTPAEPQGYRHSYHLYVLRIDFKKIKTNRASFMRDLEKRGVGSQVHYIPIYKQPYYRALLRSGPCHQAERFYASALSLPMHPGLSAADVRRVVNAVKTLCSGNVR